MAFVFFLESARTTGISACMPGTDGTWCEVSLRRLAAEARRRNARVTARLRYRLL